MNKLKQDLVELFAEGPETVQVVADFDGTLTEDFVNGKKTPSLISVLRDQPGYLSPEYQVEAHKLYDFYSKFEKAADLTLAERKDLMTEWWVKHKQLLIESGIRKEHLEKLVKSGYILWRKGAVDFLDLMRTIEVPLLVFSASGIGQVIPMFCEEQGVDSPNMHYIVNKFFWDKEGWATGFHQPVIHSLNKDETAVRDYDGIFQSVRHRSNVLLLGNSLGDLGMADGFEAQKKVTIGFLNEEEKESEGEFKKAFDHVMVGNGYLEINGVLKEILGKK